MSLKPGVRRRTLKLYRHAGCEKRHHSWHDVRACVRAAEVPQEPQVGAWWTETWVRVE